MTFLQLITPVLLVGVLNAVIAVALFFWARWVARRHRGAWWQRARWLPLAALCVVVVGISTAVVFASRAYDVTQAPHPSDKVSVLAENLSVALNSTAWFVLVERSLFAASVVISLVGSLIRPRDRPDQ